MPEKAGEEEEKQQQDLLVMVGGRGQEAGENKFPAVGCSGNSTRIRVSVSMVALSTC
jgi:hypothetical protein